MFTFFFFNSVGHIAHIDPRNCDVLPGRRQGTNRGGGYSCGALRSRDDIPLLQKDLIFPFPEAATCSLTPVTGHTCLWLVVVKVWTPALGSVYEWSHGPGLLDSVSQQKLALLR